MINLRNNLIIILFSFVNAFDLGLWKGTTHYYIRSYSNNFDLRKPMITTYNHSNVFNKTIVHNNFMDTRFFRLKLQSYDKLGGVSAKIDKKTDNTYFFTNQINFYYNSVRSIITINYTYNNDLKLQLNSIIISGLRCILTRSPMKKTMKISNLSDLKDNLKNWRYCKSTILNPKNPYQINEKELDCFDYEYMLINEKRLSHVFLDNIVISVPEIIEDNKAFSLLFGCLHTPDCYKQINLNYNFNGCLTSVEFNEYEPYNFTNKLINYINLMKNKVLYLK
jgi:hypothetical protein